MSIIFTENDRDIYLVLEYSKISYRHKQSVCSLYQYKDILIDYNTVVLFNMALILDSIT